MSIFNPQINIQLCDEWFEQGGWKLQQSTLGFMAYKLYINIHGYQIVFSAIGLGEGSFLIDWYIPYASKKCYQRVSTDHEVNQLVKYWSHLLSSLIAAERLAERILAKTDALGVLERLVHKNIIESYVNSLS